VLDARKRETSWDKRLVKDDLQPEKATRKIRPEGEGLKKGVALGGCHSAVGRESDPQYKLTENSSLPESRVRCVKKKKHRIYKQKKTNNEYGRGEHFSHLLRYARGKEKSTSKHGTLMEGTYAGLKARNRPRGCPIGSPYLRKDDQGRGKGGGNQKKETTRKLSLNKRFRTIKKRKTEGREG